MSIAQQFIEFALNQNVLRFGEFKTKAGRLSPYFFNAGLFFDGESLNQLSMGYANVLKEKCLAGFEFDALFGPAYKGITLAASTSMALAQAGMNVPYAYNRKEAKDHGEGGTLVGAPLEGKRVVIIDDVISAGTSVRESVEMLRAAGAMPVACSSRSTAWKKAVRRTRLVSFQPCKMSSKRTAFPCLQLPI